MAALVTMKDVAKRAGVSPSTVCRALTANPKISDETRRRVREIAGSMGYRVDPLLSAFASRRRGNFAGSEVTTIAYITNFPSATEWQRNAYYRRCYEGTKKRAEEMGYRLEHFWLKEKGMTGERLSRVLYHRGIVAACVAPLPQVRGHLSLKWDQLCSATIGYTMLSPAIHRAASHHFHGMLMTVRELKRRGYTRIGLCLFDRTSKRVDDLWLAAFLSARQYFPNLTMPVFLFDDKTITRIPQWCRENQIEVVVGGELVVLEQLSHARLYPEEIDYASVGLTDEVGMVAGIDQRPERIGAAVVNLLVSQVQRGERGVPEAPTTLMVEGKWVDGPSLRRK
jgi:transcriptional regulator with XRE-family HTH domain